MARNPFRAFKEIFPDPPLQVATVIAVDGDTATVELPGGGVLQVRGTTAVDARVFVRDGVIEGDAPALTVVSIDV
ncbi:hypothetical protein [Acidovorax sp. A1169]|uniref:hypothetical protein n=1 Tax=Acidovorax sp. A1169 TaxID=3059524 RepID=UPI002737E99C|nr:hypothetical protein [Acidovorax sp. A1169]MDP4074194.1 hypothetical protein [Acidovorax sp. A1169]